MGINLSDYILSLRNRRIAVLGIGVSNTPLIRLLLEGGMDVTACDKRSLEEFEGPARELQTLGAKLRLGADYLDSLGGFDVIFRTPGIHPDLPALSDARERGALITSEMEVFFEVCPCRIVAVTGSDGKTTTTTIISELLKAAGKTVHLGGNIGNPLLCEAGNMMPDVYAVLELSSFQLITMQKTPHISVITNVTPNHLDVHKSMDEYIEAKENIYLNQADSDLLVLNYDNEITRSFAGKAKGGVSFFSCTAPPENGFFSNGESIFICRGGDKRKLIDCRDIFIPGEHNVENFMAAFAAVYDIVGSDVCINTAKTFRGVEHRIEFVRELGGVRYYNDSIGTSPTRTIAGLKSFDKKVILIAGGYDKNIPFDVLGPEIIKHVKTLVLTGATAPKIRNCVETAPGFVKGQPEIIELGDFTEAILAASRSASSGDVVLLSPACASFDMFKNFMLRGEFFKKIVMELTQTV